MASTFWCPPYPNMLQAVFLWELKLVGTLVLIRKIWEGQLIHCCSERGKAYHYKPINCSVLRPFLSRILPFWCSGYFRHMSTSFIRKVHCRLQPLMSSCVRPRILKHLAFKAATDNIPMENPLAFHKVAGNENGASSWWRPFVLSLLVSVLRIE